MSKKRNFRNQRRPRRRPRRKPDAQLELEFVGIRRFGKERVVAYLIDDEENTYTVYPASRRFRPRSGDKILCDIELKGQVGLATPERAVQHTLSPEVWLPPKEFRSCLVETLTFRRYEREGKAGLKAWSKTGQAVFPDRGVEVVPDQPTPCLLHENGTFAFATPLTVEAQGSEQGLIKMVENVTGVDLAQELEYVILQTPHNAPGVAVARDEEDIVWTPEYRNVFDILGVTRDATEEDIKKAYKKKSRDVHPDKVLQPYGGADKAPLLPRLIAQSFFECIHQAHDQALDLLKRRSAKPVKAAKPARAARPRQPAKKKAPAKRPAPKKSAPKKPVVVKVGEGDEPPSAVERFKKRYGDGTKPAPPQQSEQPSGEEQKSDEDLPHTLSEQLKKIDFL